MIETNRYFKVGEIYEDPEDGSLIEITKVERVAVIQNIPLIEISYVVIEGSYFGSQSVFYSDDDFAYNLIAIKFDN